MTKQRINDLVNLANDIKNRADKKLAAINRYEDSLDPRCMRLSGEEMRLRLWHSALIELMQEAGVIE